MSQLPSGVYLLMRRYNAGRFGVKAPTCLRKGAGGWRRHGLVVDQYVQLLLSTTVRGTSTCRFSTTY